MPSAHDCTRCELHRTCRTVCMAPSAPARPLVAVVGEAPGAQEDTQGVPFVGPAGQLLWDTLAEHGLARAQAFVTNVVKCRPPNNRTPKRSEIKQCRIWLDAELEHLQDQGCRYILALGATAYRALGGSGSITEAAGAAYRYGAFTVFPALHPAAALRSPRMMEPFKQQLAAFARLVRGGPSGDLGTEVRLADSEDALREMAEEIGAAEEAAFDLETVGLDPYSKDAAIICISLSARPGHAWVVMLAHPEAPLQYGIVREYLHRIFAAEKTWIAHNGRFDRRWLQAMGFPPPTLKRDTILMAHLLDENAPKNVESVAARYLGRPGWKRLMEPHFTAIAKALEDGGQPPPPPLEALVPYAGIDADIELRLSRLLWEKLSAQERRLHDFLLRVGTVLDEAERVGVYIDRVDLQNAEAEWERAAEEAVKRFAKATGCDIDEINLGSWKWLADYLFGKLGLPVVELTDTGGPATGEHALKMLRTEAPAIVQPILDYRKATKYLGSYIRPWRSLLNERSRLRSSYNLTGTVTGRLSCTNLIRRGMSLHQVPREAEIRRLVDWYMRVNKAG